jgi:hypothetical protein
MAERHRRALEKLERERKDDPDQRADNRGSRALDDFDTGMLEALLTSSASDGAQYFCDLGDSEVGAAFEECRSRERFERHCKLAADDQRVQYFDDLVADLEELDGDGNIRTSKFWSVPGHLVGEEGESECCRAVLFRLFPSISAIVLLRPLHPERSGLFAKYQLQSVGFFVADGTC